MKIPSVQMLSFASLTVLLAASGIPLAAQSQQPNAQGDSCYMVTSSGQVLGLDKLCSTGKTAPGKAASPAGGRSTPGVYRAAIKYLLGKTPVIDVTFNGRQSFEMIVDTGADGTLITSEMAKALRLPIVGVGRFQMADGRIVNLPLARLQSISVSGAEVRNVDVAIASKNSVGLLGHDFFDSFDIKIKENMVEFYKR